MATPAKVGKSAPPQHLPGFSAALFNRYFRLHLAVLIQKTPIPRPWLIEPETNLDRACQNNRAELFLTP